MKPVLVLAMSLRHRNVSRATSSILKRTAYSSAQGWNGIREGKGVQTWPQNRSQFLRVRFGMLFCFYKCISVHPREQFWGARFGPYTLERYCSEINWSCLGREEKGCLMALSEAFDACYAVSHQLSRGCTRVKQKHS